MEEWVSVQIIPDLVKVRDALRALDNNQQTKLTRQLSTEMLRIGNRVKTQEQQSIMSTAIVGVKKDNRARIKRGRAEYQPALRADIANAMQRRNRFTKKEAGVEVRVRNGPLGDRARLPKYFNRGKNRHPLFGDRKQWFDQVARPAGWWNRVILANRDDAKRDVQQLIYKYQQIVAAALEGKKPH
jgi:hypothetical protein